jgi:Alpha-kinase family
VAYRCQLADAPNTTNFQLAPMVAKETLRTDRISERIAFHKSFCQSQSLAAHLAAEFNKRLLGMPHYCYEKTPIVSFLKCTILLLEDPQWPGNLRGVLVEKQLDTTKWQKWNDNCGGVDGQRTHRPMDVRYELAQLEMNTMTIEEASEEDSDDDDNDEDFFEQDSACTNDFMDTGGGDNGFSPLDYLQAFS